MCRLVVEESRYLPVVQGERSCLPPTLSLMGHGTNAAYSPVFGYSVGDEPPGTHMQRGRAAVEAVRLQEVVH